MIEFDCPECGEELGSPDSQKGTVEVCPVCGTMCVVPGCAVSQQIPAGVTHVFSVNDYTFSVSRRDISVKGPDRETAEKIARNTVTMLAGATEQVLVSQFPNGYAPDDQARAEREMATHLGVPPAVGGSEPARPVARAEPAPDPLRAHTRQRLLIQQTGTYTPADLTHQEADETIAQLVRDRRLTDDDVAGAWRLEEPTRKQIDYLTELGVFTPPGTTRGEAVDMIEYRKRTIPLTGSQREFIERLNGLPTARMTVHVAEQYIHYLLQHQPTCVNCRCQYPPVDEGLCSVCGAAVPPGPPIRLPADLRRSRMPVKIPKVWKKVKGLLGRRKRTR